MEPITTAALIGAAGTALGSGAGVLGQYSTNAKNLKIAREMNEWNRQMWMDANEYNTPLNQIKRLIEAGLNPRMIYGSGNVTGNVTGSSPKANTATMVNPLSNLPETLGMLGQYIQIRNENLKSDIIREDAMLRNAQRINETAKNSGIIADSKMKKELGKYADEIAVNTAKSIANRAKADLYKARGQEINIKGLEDLSKYGFDEKTQAFLKMLFGTFGSMARIQ